MLEQQALPWLDRLRHPPSCFGYKLEKLAYQLLGGSGRELLGM
jgi:hypothetical protein